MLRKPVDYKSRRLKYGLVHAILNGNPDHRNSAYDAGISTRIKYIAWILQISSSMIT